MNDQELACLLVREGGTLADRMLRDGVSVDLKTSISDVVSDADHAAERLIVDLLAAHRPEDGLVGEEGAARAGVRTWLIDPVDGTYNFVSGLPAWCSAVALLDGRDPLLGAVFQPRTDELFVGGPGAGATLNGVALPNLVDRPLDEVCLATYLHPPRMTDPGLREPLWAAIGGAAALRMIGSGSVELSAVAAGRLGLWVAADAADWDWFPGAALVLAVGGVAEVVEHRGHRFHLAGLPTAVAQARTLLLAA